MIIGPDFTSMMKCTETEIPPRSIIAYQGTVLLSDHVIISRKCGLALLAQILCHEAHKTVKNLVISVWKSFQGF